MSRTHWHLSLLPSDSQSAYSLGRSFPHKAQQEPKKLAEPSELPHLPQFLRATVYTESRLSLQDSPICKQQSYRETSQVQTHCCRVQQWGCLDVQYHSIRVVKLPKILYQSCFHLLPWFVSCLTCPLNPSGWQRRWHTSLPPSRYPCGLQQCSLLKLDHIPVASWSDKA